MSAGRRSSRASDDVGKRKTADEKRVSGSAGWESYLLDVANGRPGLAPAALRTVTSALAPVYCAGLKTYLLPYTLGLRKRKRLKCPVVCVGNLTTGGTGKTPMTQMLCRALQAQGRRVVVLSRGYGGENEYGCAIVSEGAIVAEGTEVSEGLEGLEGAETLLTAKQAGDEAYLLASTLPGVPVIVGKDRRITGELAVQRFRPDIIVLDDGMQFWQLHRDLDIVLLNACKPFDNGWTFPRGLLREPPSHLRRAGIVVLTNARRAGLQQVEIVKTQAQRYAPGRPIFTADLTASCLRMLSKSTLDTIGTAPEGLRGKRIAAVSALGNPASFEATLEDLGAEVVARCRFRDHEAIAPEELEQVLLQARQAGAEAIVTTEKDAVKMTPAKNSENSEYSLPMYALQVVMRVEPQEEFIDAVNAVMDTIQ